MSRTPLRLLRSRRLAIGLLTGIIVYSFIGTLVPQTSRVGAPAVSSWQAGNPWLAPVTRLLGLHDAFSAPLFLVAVGILSACTVACAWERSSRSLKLLRAGGRIEAGEARRLKERPTFSVATSPGTTVPDALNASASALRALGLKVQSGQRALEASSSDWALIGSPMFHVALALLIVVIGLGRLSRAEGLIGLPEGFARADSAQSYARESSGPLYPGRSGLTLVASDIRPFTDEGGVYRGVSPVISLSRGDEPIARQRVYPNNPLRYGALLIHYSDYGLAASISVETSKGEELLQAQPLLDFGESPGLAGPTEQGLVGPDGREVAALTLSIPLDRVKGKGSRTRPRDRRVQMTVIPTGGEPLSAVLRPGEALTLRTGERIRLNDIVYYARVSVADDWSVYPIYALFAVAAIGMTLSLVLPYRRVLARAHDEEGAVVVDALLVHMRGDHIFRDRVEGAMRAQWRQEEVTEERE